MKRKIVYIAPHLSTGGMPQYLVKQVESIKNDMDVYCIEWGDVTGGVLVVQRNKMVKLLGDRLITLGEDKHELFSVLNRINPDIIHLQEIPEYFMPGDIADKLYRTDRQYVLIETSHDSGYNADNKVYIPDKFLMVSKFQTNEYQKLNIPMDIVEYPIENKIRTKTREQALRDLGLDPNLKHVINVGLFTPRKNQAEVIEYARMLKNYPIQFHFLGNHADNFQFYWGPLMEKFPSNCKWWNERSDVDTFYEAADLFLFTSRGNPTDMETMPLVIREALSWKIPSLIYNLPVYMGYFDKYDTIEYLKDNLQENAYRIAEKLLREPQNHHTPTGTNVMKTIEDLLKTKRLSFYDAYNGVNELYGLQDMIQEHFTPDFTMVEVGSFEGASTELFARTCKEVHSVDPYLPYAEIPHHYMQQAENTFLQMQQRNKNVSKTRKVSLEAVKDFTDGSLDAVYIDGAHDYDNVKADILAWLPKVKLGGVICGHDYHAVSSEFGTDVIAKVLKELFPTEKVYTYKDSSWLVKKPTTKKEIFILSAYANTRLKEKALVDVVNQLKSLGKDVLLATHYPVPDYIVEKVDYYIYDKNNLPDTIRTLENTEPDYWERQANFRVEFIFTRHIPSLCRIFSIALDFVHNLGYENFIMLESDGEYTTPDLKEFDELLNQMTRENKRLIFFEPKPTEFNWYGTPVYESYCFGGNVLEFISTIRLPRTIPEWEALKQTFTAPSVCLEQVLYDVFNKKKENYLIVKSSLKGVLRNSKLDLFTASNKFGVLYNLSDENHPVLYFTNYEADEVEYRYVTPYAMYRERKVPRNVWAYEMIDLFDNQSADIKIQKYIDGELVAEVHEILTKENIKELKKFRTFKFE